MNLARRSLLWSLVAAPAVIRIPGILMPVRPGDWVEIPVGIHTITRYNRTSDTWEVIDRLLAEGMKLSAFDEAPFVLHRANGPPAFARMKGLRA